MTAHVDVAVRGTVSARGTGPAARAAGFARSAGLWVVVAVVALLAAIATVLVQGGEDTSTLHFESTRDDGGRAFVQTLDTHGRDITATESLEDAGAAIDAGQTVLIYAGTSTQSSATIEDLSHRAAESGARLVLIEPREEIEDWTNELELDFPESSITMPDRRPPECEADVPGTAGVVRYPSAGLEYFSRVSDPEDSHFCYASDSHEFIPHGGYVEIPHGEAGGTLTVMGSDQWFYNSELAHEGHMSLIAGALGNDRPITYYYPVPGDQPAEAVEDDPVFSLFPVWALAAILWTLPVALVAMLVYGRRLGPLAVEPLPVVVPAAETVRGRSALLQRAQAREEALADLRMAALTRLGRRLALPPDIPAAEVAARAAAHSGFEPTWTEQVLLTERAHDDESLIRIAIDITTIENEVDPL